MPETRAAVEAVLAAHPELSAYGAGLCFLGDKTLDERKADHQREREEMLGTDVLVQFEEACRFIRETGIRKTINHNRSSYGWKHVAEEWSGVYICNGAMIAAAYHMGVPAQRMEGPNPLLAIREPKPSRPSW
jgi:hypothetical protein